jgi:hypothetical protein
MLWSVLELGRRERSQPAPPGAVWASLADPRRPGTRQWLTLLPDEIEPRILEQHEPDLVVWSSLWPDRPDDRIRFDVFPADRGCRVRWTLLTLGPGPGQSRLAHQRFRLNVLVNEGLRQSYGQ